MHSPIRIQPKAKMVHLPNQEEIVGYQECIGRANIEPRLPMRKNYTAACVHKSGDEVHGGMAPVNGQDLGRLSREWSE